LAQVEDGQLEEDTIALFREINVLRARAVRHIDEIDARRSFEGEGYLSTASWLRDKCRLTAKEARGLVGSARALRSMAATRRAFAAGDITYPAAQMLGIARDAHPEVFRRDESMLVEQAKVLSPRGLRQALDYWRQAADEDSGVSAAERRHRRRRLFVSQTLDGMVRLDADLDPEGGAIVIAAIRAHAEPGALDPSDDRSGPQRRADALVELCRTDLDNGTAPDSGGEKPHVLVLVDLQTLQGHRGSLSEFDDGTVIDAETARRLACDAGVSRVLVNGGSAPLDIGRKTRTVPAGLRRALVVRDRGCTYAGCDRPPRWCEAHHIIPWAQNGPTSLENLRLLCRRHHRMLHPEHAQGGPDP
jgi:hypothetical protein